MGAAADTAVFRFITVSEEKRPEAVSGIQTVCVVRGMPSERQKRASDGIDVGFQERNKTAAAASAATDNAAASAALPAKRIEVLPSMYLKPVIIGRTRFFFLNTRYAATAAI